MRFPGTAHPNRAVHLDLGELEPICCSRRHFGCPVAAVAVPCPSSASVLPLASLATAARQRTYPAGAAVATATASTMRASDCEPRSARTAAPGKQVGRWWPTAPPLLAPLTRSYPPPPPHHRTGVRHSNVFPSSKELYFSPGYKQKFQIFSQFRRFTVHVATCT